MVFTESILQPRKDEMRKRLTLLAVIGAVALCIGCSTESNTNTNNTTTTTNTTVSRTTTNSANIANTTANTNANPAGSLSSADREFLTKAAQGGLMEVELGRLAAQKAQNADVKRFGQRMVDDHSKVNAELKTLASAKGVTLPADMNAEGKEEQAKLSKLSGAEFDKEYMSLMVEDHEKDVSEFEKESKDQDDPDVKAFAAKTLPTLQQHLQTAQSINPKLK
jgi:putative membrane protein